MFLNFPMFPSFSLLPDQTRIERYLGVLADQMVSEKEYNEFENFLQTKSKLFTGVERAIQQSLEKIRANSMWQEKNYKQIGRLLTEY